MCRSIIRITKYLSVIMAVMALTLVAGPASASGWDQVKKPITQVYSSGVSKKHATFVGLNPYFKKLDKISGSKFKTKSYPGGMLFKIKVALKGLTDGGCDSSCIVVSYHPAELPVTNLITDSLLNFSDPVATSGATCELMSLNSGLFEKEHKKANVYMFGSYATTAYELHSRKEANSLEGIKGLKVRAGGAAHVRFVKGLGMVPVALATAEAYEALMRGTLDGCMGAMDFQRSFGFWDVAKNVLMVNAGVFNGVPTPTFRRDWFDKLPKVAKRALVANYAMVPAMTTIDGYVKKSELVKKEAVKKGTKILEPDAGLKKAIAEFIKKDTDGLVAMAAEKRGIDKALAAKVINTYLKLYQKWLTISQKEIKNNTAKFIQALNREVYNPLIEKMGLN